MDWDPCWIHCFFVFLLLSFCWVFVYVFLAVVTDLGCCVFCFLLLFLMFFNSSAVILGFTLKWK